MIIAGFPDKIQVTLGAAWLGLNGLDPLDVIVLTRIGATDFWSEDGTDVASPTNRLRINPVGQVPMGHSLWSMYLTPATAPGYATWGSNGFAANSLAIATGTTTTYNFGDVWNNWTPPIAPMTGCFSRQNNLIAAGFLTGSPVYKPTVFSSFEEVVPAAGSILGANKRGGKL